MKRSLPLLALTTLSCAGPLRNAPPPPLAPRPVDLGFTSFWSGSLHTTTSASAVVSNKGQLRLGETSTQTTTFLRGPQDRIAFGVIEDGALHGRYTHRMQFLLLPAEVIDAASDGDTLCSLRNDAKMRCKSLRPRRGSEQQEFDVPKDAARVLLISDEKRCVLRSSGDWSCWLGSFSQWSESSSVADDLRKFGPAAAPVPDSRCFLTRDGSLVCMDDRGYLGTVVQRDVVQASVGSGIGDFAAGCAVKRDGRVVCWGGANDTGTSGDGVQGEHPEPWIAKELKDVASVARSVDHACALTRAHTVYCWGSADGWAFGEAALKSATKYRLCGRGESSRNDHCVAASRFSGPHNHLQLTPVHVPELDGVVSIAAGHERTCGVRTDGRVLCLGSGHPGAWSIDVGEK